MRSFVLCLALAALLATAAYGAEDVEKVDDAAAGEGEMEPELDADGEAKAELEKIDANKDGKADLGEITEYMKKEFYGPEAIAEEKLTPADVDKKAAEDAKEYLGELDTNKDGNLDHPEIKKHYEYTEDEAGEGEEGAEE